MNRISKSKYYRLSVRLVTGFAVILFLLAGCTEMDHTYEEFWKDGERVYPAPADSVKVYPGKNRIGLSWLILSDPKVNRATIYWDNKNDSIEIPIEATGRANAVNVMLNDMEERSYAFTIYTYDEKGNKSIPVNAVGSAYGDLYINSLLTRIVENATFLNDTLIVDWGDAMDETSMGEEISYLDTMGNSQVIKVSPAVESTIITDFNFEAGPDITYRSAYLPNTMAIDTFYTEYASVRVKGPAVDLPRTNWMVTASSYDERQGTARAPESAIDGNPSTMWVNQISTQTYFPHSLTVDMGKTVEGVEGFYLLCGNRNETPRNVEILVSSDGIEYSTMGIFPVQKIGDKQYFDFAEVQNIRFIRMIGIDSYGSPNIVIFEFGTFTR